MPYNDGEVMVAKCVKNLKGVRAMFFPLVHEKMKWVMLTVAVLSIFHTLCFAADDSPSGKVSPPVLKKAVLCEQIIDSGKPVNEGVVFSSGLGRLICFTDFEPVYEEMYIYHKYYFKDKLISKKRLTLKPPRWATYSRIQLREDDKGPWRVEITDTEGQIFSIIRFSITD